MSEQFGKQNGRNSKLFENHFRFYKNSMIKDAIKLEILQLDSSNVHKRYMARKTK